MSTVLIILAAWIGLNILLAAAWAWACSRRRTSGPRGADTSAQDRSEPTRPHPGSRRVAVLTSLTNEEAGKGGSFGVTPALKLAHEAKARKRIERIWTHVTELRSEIFPKCRCELHPGMTHDELLELGSGCTAGRWVCPVLDAYRRALGRRR